jgi:hypothetical protein
MAERTDMIPQNRASRKARVVVAAALAGATWIGVLGSVRYMASTTPVPPAARTRVVVPGVVGHSLCEALRAMRSRGLSVARVIGRTGDLVELPATVVAQIPSALEQHREPEPVLLEAIASRQVDDLVRTGADRTVTTRRRIARLATGAGLREVAVLRRGAPRGMETYRSGACEPVVITVYRFGGGSVVLMQTLGEMVPQGRDARIGRRHGQRVGVTLYWHERSYLLGLAPARKGISGPIRWLGSQTRGR